MNTLRKLAAILAVERSTYERFIGIRTGPDLKQGIEREVEPLIRAGRLFGTGRKMA